MRKINLISILIIFTLCSFDSSNNKINDRTGYELKGNVKSLVEKTFLATDKFGEITKDDDNVFRIYKVEYNDNGNKVEESTFMYLNKYRYYDNGRLCETRMYNSDGSLSTVLTFEYMGDTISIQKCYINNNSYAGKRIRKFDNSGNLIKILDYNSKDILKGKSIYKYDNKGNNIQFFNYDSNGKLVYKSELYTYDDKGYIDSKTNIYKYDNKGNLIETTIKNIVTKYEYDENGNWIKCFTTNEDQPEVIEREIIYY